MGVGWSLHKGICVHIRGEIIVLLRIILTEITGSVAECYVIVMTSLLEFTHKKTNLPRL